MDKNAKVSKFNAKSKHGEQTNYPETTTKQVVKSRYGPKESYRILKNVFVLGFSFTLLYTAYKGMANLQSSISSEGGLGVYTLGIKSGAYVISSLILPSFCLAKLKCKWTMIVATLGYILYQVSQFYRTFATMIPSSIFLGICLAPMWTAQSVYITVIAGEYAQLKQEIPEVVLQRFCGIFFCFFQSSQILGNLISSFLLNGSWKVSKSESKNTSIQDLQLCGYNFCDEDVSSHKSHLNQTLSAPQTHPAQLDVHILVGIFVGCSFFATLLIFLFLDPLSRYLQDKPEKSDEKKWFTLLAETVQHCKKPLQILLIPFTFWVGIQEVLFTAEFTKGYITCAWGVDKIGFAMICFGVGAAGGSVVIGKAIEYVGRPSIFSLAALLNLACLIVMLYWEPHPSKPILFFLLPALWGLADGIWTPQIKALYGTVFPNSRHAGFNNVHLWMSIGYMTVYLISDSLCMEEKLYLNFVLLGLAMLCYGAVEIVLRYRLGKRFDL